jgi:hypothetical protein
MQDTKRRKKNKCRRGELKKFTWAEGVTGSLAGGAWFEWRWR